MMSVAHGGAHIVRGLCAAWWRARPSRRLRWRAAGWSYRNAMRDDADADERYDGDGAARDTRLAASGWRRSKRRGAEDGRQHAVAHCKMRGVE
jgi:hypothetical protein